MNVSRCDIHGKHTTANQAQEILDYPASGVGRQLVAQTIVSHNDILEQKDLDPCSTSQDMFDQWTCDENREAEMRDCRKGMWLSESWRSA